MSLDSFQLSTMNTKVDHGETAKDSELSFLDPLAKRGWFLSLTLFPVKVIESDSLLIIVSKRAHLHYPHYHVKCYILCFR